MLKKDDKFKTKNNDENISENIELTKSVMKGDIFVSEYMSNSKLVRRAGKYLQVGFLNWWKRRCKAEKEHPVKKQPEELWDKLFKGYMKAPVKDKAVIAQKAKITEIKAKAK